MTCDRGGLGAAFGCLRCLAGPNMPCANDDMLPANLPDHAAVSYVGPGTIPPRLEVSDEPVDVGRCWDCHCPITKLVYRTGSDQPVCQDCREFAATTAAE